MDDGGGNGRTGGGEERHVGMGMVDRSADGRGRVVGNDGEREVEREGGREDASGWWERWIGRRRRKGRAIDV